MAQDGKTVLNFSAEAGGKTDNGCAGPQPGLVSVVDVGSNSVRLVVFEDGVRSPDYFFNEKTICKLGLGLGETGRLNPEGKMRAMAALKRFAALVRRMGAREVLAIGTAALREAEDGAAFRTAVAKETGLDIHVATGLEEARLAAQGVLLGWPRAEGVVADLGGSSLELTRVMGGQPTSAVSVPAGHLRLADPESEETRRAMQALSASAGAFAMTPQEPGRLILVGGAWRALAKAHMAQRDYPMHVLQGYEILPTEAEALCDWAIEAPLDELKDATDVSTSRLASVAAGARALRRLIGDLGPRGISLSAFGVREGLMFERMTAEMRSEEPLLSAAAATEARNARCPGFGDELFTWMAPVLEGFSEEWLRLSHAACLLHDVNWRTHPDYRASACFGTVTRANLGGVGHMGRLFMGAALIHRYKGAGQDKEAGRAVASLPADTRAAAEVVGRAARLGAMLSGSAIGTLSRCPLERRGQSLVLTFTEDAGEFAGERVERRFRALANAMGLSPETTT